MAQRIKRITGDGRFAYPFAAAMLACTLLFAAADPAYADIAGDINAWLCGVLRDTCNWIFEGQVNMLKGIGAEGVLSASFTQMLGSAGSVTMYDIVHGVWQVAVLPIGCGILGFVVTV